MKIAIIGGGIGGLATAISLQKIGIKAHVYERAKSFNPLGAGIGIGSNVMRALHELNISDSILKMGIPLYEQRFLNEKFDVMNTIDFSLLKKRFGEETITIERAHLHRVLYNNLDKHNIHFNKQVISFKQCSKKVTLLFTDGTQITADYVIAADGLQSVFRRTLTKSSQPRYGGYTCWRGISKNRGNVESHISSEAWSKKGRFGWAPLFDDKVYWFACLNAREKDEYFQSLNKFGVAHHFQHFPSVVQQLIQDTEEAYFLHHDIYDIKPLNTFIYDRICLLGDAAHATTPNMGQGAGQSIEDAFQLMKAIKKTSSIENAFKFYDKKRVTKTKKVIEISRQIGRAAQWDNDVLVHFRDTFFPFIPSSLLFWRLTFLFES